MDGLHPLPESSRDLNPILLVLFRELEPLYPHQIAQALAHTGVDQVSARRVRATLRWLHSAKERLPIAETVVRDPAGRFRLTDAGRRLLARSPVDELDRNGARSAARPVVGEGPPAS